MYSSTFESGSHEVALHTLIVAVAKQNIVRKVGGRIVNLYSLQSFITHQQIQISLKGFSASSKGLNNSRS